MKNIEGYIFKSNAVNKNGHIYAKDCKISFPEKVPITLGFDFNKPGKVIGNGSIVQKEDGLYINGKIYKHFVEDYWTHMGLYATNVKKDKDDNIIEMTIRDVALLPEYEASMPECKIVRK